MQLILTIVFYAWLFAILMLVFLMWRNSISRIAHMQQALIDLTTKSTDAAKAASEAAQRIALALEKKFDA